MKVLRFTGQKIYGYIDLDIELNSDITFLTGINGCGKTTAINCIASLLSPNFQYLCSTDFNFLSLDIIFYDSIKTISCSKTTTGIIISCSEIPEILEITGYMPDTEVSFAHGNEEEEYYRTLQSRIRLTPVLAFLTKLPTPMYLGLNRRAFIDDQSFDFRLKRPLLRRSSRRPRGFFANTLELSFLEAIALAEADAYRTQFAVSSLNTVFQKKLLSELMQMDPFDFSNEFHFPTKTDLARLSETAQKIDRLPSLLGFKDTELTQKIQPLIERLVVAAKDLSKHEKRFKKDENIGNDILQQILVWQFNQQNFKKVLKLSEIFDEYGDEQKLIKDKSSRYTMLINRFLNGSKKTVSFDNEGKIIFRAGIEEDSPVIDSLSSGEIQVFVLITHLFFNPSVQGGNIVIIDEPELSLHVQWQELFVDSLLEASEDVQFLLATHSPSIILDRINRCIGLSGE